ncbi:putative F-box domain-containing protein [Helianthus annuus]|nr:putative F-box domain-containing protein [Helianthus annuus]
MSDNIPYDIQVDILKKLPVKSLIQFRSICKAWKSLVDSADFVKHYRGQMQHLLVSYYEHSYSFGRKYVSIADDDTFPQKKVPLTNPMSLNNPRLIGTSHGLLCLYSYSDDMVVIWNLCIRKVVAVVLYNVEHDAGSWDYLGFGVCRETNDPKIIRIRSVTWCDINGLSYVPWQVEVFPLSTGAWRTPFSTNFPSKSIYFRFENYDQVVIDGVHYWLANDISCNLIFSFDMTREEFSEINLPDGLAHKSDYTLSMSKLRESIVVLDRDDDEMVFVVWMMEDGVSKTFTKPFTINYNTPDALYFVSGFRKTGEAIIEGRRQLFVYEPYSKHIKNFGIDGNYYDFFVHSYMETLILLDQPNLRVFN